MIVAPGRISRVRITRTQRIEHRFCSNCLPGTPKSSIGANVGAKVGRFLESEELAEMVKGVPNTEAYRLIAARVQHEIENLRDGKRDKFDVAAVRKKWRAERRKTRKQEPVIDE